MNVDAADRMLPTGTATGTIYDPWGRITTLPAALTSTASAGVASVSYYANDLVRSLAQGGATRTWALDPANRLATMTSTGLGATALTNHYGDPGTDSPTWTVDTAADATVSTRRYVGGLAGFLAEITTTAAGVSTSTVELTGLHGDVLRTSTPTATGSPDGPGNDTDEYGIVHDSTGAITTGPRYNWLGGKQRATDTTGLTLMGVRLYTPTTGRFLSGDPIYGGNANTYSYPADPVNGSDTNGLSDGKTIRYIRFYQRWVRECLSSGGGDLCSWHDGYQEGAHNGIILKIKPFIQFFSLRYVMTGAGQLYSGDRSGAGQTLLTGSAPAGANEAAKRASQVRIGRHEFSQGGKLTVRAGARLFTNVFGSVATGMGTFLDYFLYTS